MTRDPTPAELWLVRFRGRSGACRRLEMLEERLADLESRDFSCGGRRFDDVGPVNNGNPHSDPTYKAAVGAAERTAMMESEAFRIEGVIGAAGRVLSVTPHGDVLNDFYLQADDMVLWPEIADEHKVSVRTCLRWRDQGIAWLDGRTSLWARLVP